MDKIYTVVTGDVRESSVDFGKRQELLLRKIHDIYNFVKDYFPDHLPYDIDIFRGDSFQFFIADYEKSIKIVISFILYAKYKGINTKIGLGIGRIDYLSKSKISESNGEAFLLSGTALENLKKDSYIDIELSDKFKAKHAKAYMNLLDIYLESLSAKNAISIFGKLVDLTQKEIVTLRGDKITRQSISKHWRKVKVDKFIKSLEQFSNSLADMLSNTTL